GGGWLVGGRARGRPPPALGGLLGRGWVDREGAHGRGGGGKKGPAAPPALVLPPPPHPQKALMHQRRGLERLARFFLSQTLPRQLAQLFVDQRQELVSGTRVPLFDGRQDSGDFTHQ